MSDHPTVCVAHGAFLPCREDGEHRTTNNPYWVKAVRDYQGSTIDGLTWEPAWPAEPDPVNSPEHYRWLPVEVIEITEHLSFTLGNVVKYVLRADHKGRPLEDLEKAAWYLDREIQRRKRGD